MFNNLAAAITCLLFASHVTAMPAGLLQNTNDRPVIGILTQMVTDEVMKPYGDTYIPAAYVKYIESGGSRVMPIRVTYDAAYYEDVFRKINGLILIGGAADLMKSDFARVAKIFFNLALKAYDAGDYFPIWGTCMGLQQLSVLVAGENLLTETTAENEAMPLNFTAEGFLSRMFQDFPSALMKAISEEPLTGNFHRYGLTVKTFLENKYLNNFFTILSTNIADNGAHFVSTIEGKKYPIYGVQWHPEVNRFSWDDRLNFPHSYHAVQVSSLLAQFFVNEGRRSLHRFEDPTEEAKALIYTYAPVYTANFTSYEQVYFF
ncbi:hypothetical protein WMY93_005147 [Mugilogobius chulae]|uniref:folate gamma-glutamyl hydrolase n=1 Tax=Mugilogobius chulae TaxID=88201 RepID=A0AAW0Q0B8_9GOBI